VLAALVWINASLLDRADMQRERAQFALGAIEQRTSKILEAALDAVISIDKAGVINGWSAQAESLFGWRREEANDPRAVGPRSLPEGSC
jgi:PAS domain-containing protein